MRNRRNWKDRPRSSGYEVHVPEGDDATRHYKKLKKRMTKDGRYFISNVEKRREEEKRIKREIAKERKRQQQL